ncbi:MAG: hypothetical protein ABSA12_14830 [Verrucomicrobiia bacterium]
MQSSDTDLNQPMSVGEFFGLVTLAAIIGVCHLAYTSYIGYRLFELRGGIQQRSLNGWFERAPISKAWTCPVHLPGGLLFAMGEAARHGDHLDPFDPIGGLAVLAGSFFAGWATSSIIQSLLLRRRPALGRYLWRLWLAVFCWGWILVPVQMSFVYQWTVRY